MALLISNYYLRDLLLLGFYGNSSVYILPSESSEDMATVHEAGITPVIACKFFRDYLSVKSCEGFLCFVGIARVRLYYVDFFVFFVLRH